MEQEKRICPSTEAEEEYIQQSLREYNRKYWKNMKDYSFHIKEDGKIVAGIVGGSCFDTLEIDFLFVEEAYRGKGYGRQLLQYAEEKGKADGLKRVFLNTYSFQAPEFYKSQGYWETFRIDHAYGTCSQFFYQKEL